MPLEPSAAALMRLTARDRYAMQVLLELRYMTSPQLQEVCYPTRSVRGTARRLGILRERGLVHCLRHRTFDDRRAFWGLTPLGRAAGSALGDAPAPRAAVYLVAALHMDHLVVTNQVFCDLCREHQSGRLGTFRWFASHRASVELEGSRLVPDAVILVPSPDSQWWMYCLEVDRGTMGTDALREKLERYRVMRSLAASHPGDPLWEARADSWLMFACQARERAKTLAGLAQAVGLERVWAGLAEECASRLAGAVSAAGTGGEVPAPPGLGQGLTPPPGGSPGRTDSGRDRHEERVLPRRICTEGTLLDRRPGGDARSGRHGHRARSAPHGPRLHQRCVGVRGDWRGPGPPVEAVQPAAPGHRLVGAVAGGVLPGSPRPLPAGAVAGDADPPLPWGRAALRPRPGGGAVPEREDGRGHRPQRPAARSQEGEPRRP